MGERAVSIISSIAIINLLVTTLICWFRSKDNRFYFWLGWLIFSAAVAMLNNLHIFLGYGSIWFHHLSMLLNLSYGAYLILFIRNHIKRPSNRFSQNLILFLPSYLYIPFIILCLILPKWGIDTIQLAEEGKLTIFGILFNLIIVTNSIGTNAWLLVREIRNKKLELELSNRIQRIEMLGVMLILQLMAFVPFVLKLDVSYIIVYMPIFGQLYFLYLFLRMWKLDKKDTEIYAKSRNSVVDSSMKYATIKLSDEKLYSIQNQIVELMKKEKPYLIPEYSIADLSNQIGVTTNILSMVINSKMQLTFPELINKYRVEKAKELLLNMKKNRSTIETIAYDCGFSNRTSFYTSFRKFTGQSPSDFLKDIEKGNLSVG